MAAGTYPSSQEMIESRSRRPATAGIFGNVSADPSLRTPNNPNNKKPPEPENDPTTPEGSAG